MQVFRQKNMSQLLFSEISIQNLVQNSTKFVISGCFIQNIVQISTKFVINICVIQKKAVPLQRKSCDENFATS